MRNLPERKHLRLRDYDYRSPGAYFVTICAYKRQPIFGYQSADGIVLVERGKIAEVCWNSLAEGAPNVSLDTYVVMPNHVHAILWLHDDPPPHAQQIKATWRGTTPGSLSSYIQTYKAAVTRRINALFPGHNKAIWQRGYYEHVIRTEQGLAQAREYIANNPLRWADDLEYVP